AALVAARRRRPSLQNTFARDAGYHYYLLRLDPEAGTVDVRGLRRMQSQEANAAYTDLERGVQADWSWS
ncbi:MAG: hypothetical protein M3Z35_17605, partial [Nitrospirota bacterium]|nr:hypothetical protein [Nitrospirota bacterium]